MRRVEISEGESWTRDVLLLDRLVVPSPKVRPPLPPASPSSLPPPAPSVVRPRASTTTTGTSGAPAKKPRRPDRHDTGNTGSAASPSWSAPPPEQLQIPRTKLLVGAAVVVVVVGVFVSRRTGVLSEAPPPAAIIVTPDGMVNAQPAQEDLLAQAMAPGVPPAEAIEVLSKCIAFDPESKVGLEATQARLRLLISQADAARARRDLRTLERRMGSDERAAPMLAALSKSVAELEEAQPPLPPVPEAPPEAEAPGLGVPSSSPPPSSGEASSGEAPPGSPDGPTAPGSSSSPG